MNSKFNDIVKEGNEARARRDVETAATKEHQDQEKFRTEVEKEKERIRTVALEELKAEEGVQSSAADTKGEKDTELSKSSSSTLTDDTAPPYLEPTK